MSLQSYYGYCLDHSCPRISYVLSSFVYSRKQSLLFDQYDKGHGWLDQDLILQSFAKCCGTLKWFALFLPLWRFGTNAVLIERLLFSLCHAIVRLSMRYFSSTNSTEDPHRIFSLSWCYKNDLTLTYHKRLNGEPLIDSWTTFWTHILKFEIFSDSCY